MPPNAAKTPILAARRVCEACTVLCCWDEVRGRPVTHYSCYSLSPNNNNSPDIYLSPARALPACPPETARLKQTTYRSQRQEIECSSTAPAGSAAQWEAKIKILHHGYGLSETGPMISRSPKNLSHVSI